MHLRGALNNVRSITTAAVRRVGRSVGQSLASAGESWPTYLRELRAESELRGAFAAGRLQARYEPIVSLASGRAVGFEALTRWVREDGTPSSFGPHVAVAEESGLIVPIGEWILRRAATDLAGWDDESLWVSVNVSARQLADKTFLPALKGVLAETALEPERLKLEITESTALRDADHAKALWRIKDLGVCLHMDDFGTGYSSLASLHRFPIDVLKIDRAFVRNTSACRDYAAVMSSVVALAHNLGMETVAEGLEEPSQVALLRAMGCDYGQGYYWSQGMSAAEVATFRPRGGRVARSA